MDTANLFLWIAGLTLQVLLLYFLLRRRLVRRVPVFSLLLAFYLVRAGLLYGLFSRLAHHTYGTLYSALSLTDLCLQILVALQIALHTARETRPFQSGRRLTTGLLFALGIITAASAAEFLPQRGRIPLDRGLVFATLLMIVLLLWMLIARVRGIERRIAGGFAIYGIVAIIAGVARNYAILYRNRSGYAAASYIDSGVYVCIVAFWIVSVCACQPRQKLPRAEAVR